MSEHKLHYFVVDKSNKFSKCSHCGLVRKRKIIGWDAQEREGMIAELHIHIHLHHQLIFQYLKHYNNSYNNSYSDSLTYIITLYFIYSLKGFSTSS